MGLNKFLIVPSQKPHDSPHLDPTKFQNRALFLDQKID